jgi:hypothetical protein
MENKQTRRETAIDPVVPYLKGTAEELKYAILKSQILANDLKTTLSILRFEPSNWIDPDSQDPRCCLSIENGVLKVYDSVQKTYSDLTSDPDLVLAFVFRLLELLDEGKLKLKEEL